MRRRDEETRICMLDDRLGALFMRRIGVGVQEQYCNGLNALRDSLGGNAAHLILVHRNQHGALCVHSLANLIAMFAADQRLVLLEEKVIGFRPVYSAYFVDVAEALRREQRTWRASPLEDRVDSDSRSM